MNVGDKVLCIKDHHLYSCGIVCKKNNFYKILKIKTSENISDEQDNYITTTSEGTDKRWSIYNEGAYYNFSDFFINNSEIRRLKLKKLNNYEI